MDIEKAREVALSMVGVTEDQPFGPDVVTFRIGGKIFMAISLDSIDPKITIKLESDYSVELREKYESIQPAFHWNKKYWNDVYLDLLNDDMVEDLIRRSYHIVFDSLPKKVKETIK